MKGLFLFSKECPPSWVSADARYQFEPYSYGPFSREVYDDLRTLVRLGLVAGEVVPGRDWKAHRLTARGNQTAGAIAPDWPIAVRSYLGKLRHFITRVSFSRLLEIVYGKYPDYAVNSVFQRQS